MTDKKQRGDHKPIKVSKGKYTYRGYAIENLGPIPGYYGGTAFRPNRWKLVGNFRSYETLKFLCEGIDEWLDDPFWKDENGENKSPLKHQLKENASSESVSDEIKIS